MSLRHGGTGPAVFVGKVPHDHHLCVLSGCGVASAKNGAGETPHLQVSLQTLGAGQSGAQSSALITHSGSRPSLSWTGTWRGKTA